jgi:hypothetical protein
MTGDLLAWRRAPEIDEMAVQLVCWQGWNSGPVSGLARWHGDVYWFDYLARWDRSDAEWGYYLGLYQLSERELHETVDWFREKERWSADPDVQELRMIPDAGTRALLLRERGLGLREWRPRLRQQPVAWFRQEKNPDFHGFRTKDRWRLPEDWPA